MEQSGRKRWQRVANRAAPKTAEIGKFGCRGLRPVAMVRRGSPVRVRKRALEIQNPRKAGIFVAYHSTTEYLRITIEPAASSPWHSQTACKSSYWEAPWSTSLRRREPELRPLRAAPIVPGNPRMRVPAHSLSSLGAGLGDRSSACVSAWSRTLSVSLLATNAASSVAKGEYGSGSWIGRSPRRTTCAANASRGRAAAASGLADRDRVRNSGYRRLRNPTMPRRVTPSQFRSMLRQQEQKAKRAIQDYDRAV
jgi:hypothetical protein